MPRPTTLSPTIPFGRINDSELSGATSPAPNPKLQPEFRRMVLLERLLREGPIRAERSRERRAMERLARDGLAGPVVRLQGGAPVFRVTAWGEQWWRKAVVRRLRSQLRPRTRPRGPAPQHPSAVNDNRPGAASGG